MLVYSLWQMYNTKLLIIGETIINTVWGMWGQFVLSLQFSCKFKTVLKNKICKKKKKKERERQKFMGRDFPGASGGKTPCPQRRGPRFDPNQGTRPHVLQLRVHMLQ